MGSNYIFRDKISNFVSQDINSLLSSFKNKFQEIYGNLPEIEQVMAWKSSILYLQQALNDADLYKFTVVFEYRLPLDNERVDLLIFGKDKKDKPKVLVFELKGWKYAKETELDFIVESDIGETVHPEYQVKHYVGKIKFSHSEAAKFRFVPVVLMYNADPKKISLNFEDVKRFYKKDLQNLRKFIRFELVSPLEEDEITKFLSGKYVQSKRLFDAIREHFDEIRNKSYLTLAENGWALSSEQLELIEEVIHDLKQNKSGITYLIQGAPGSGKTLVAINLLLYALKEGYQTILTYRNNRLIHSIRKIFDSVEKGISDSIEFYSVGSKAGFWGVAEKNFRGSSLDLVIYDEAQRMTTENIKYALRRGRITVFFYDEGQILNAEEEGYTKNFIRIAQELSKVQKSQKLNLRFLKGSYRVRGGKHYHDFVETLLRKPECISQGLINSWKYDYDFKVFDDIEDLILALERKRIDSKVALVAAFTESPGDKNNKNSEENLRIGYPLYSGFKLYENFNRKIYWLMDPKNDYVPFWIEGKSNKLDRCASIYGCQGFEADFVGVIWGRDYVYRNGKWELGENCEDNIGKPSLKELINEARRGDKKAEQQALKLLINRYRIFLTRGIKGTYIFCEDRETARFLKNIYKKYF